MDSTMGKNKAASKPLLGVLIYSAVLLAVIFYAAREAFIEFSRLMTTNIPWVESVLVIAAFMFVGILAILALGLILASCKEQGIDDSLTSIEVSAVKALLMSKWPVNAITGQLSGYPEAGMPRQ